MRYEVLRMLYDAARRAPAGEVHAWGFAGELGVWHTEVFRAIDFLDREGLLEYLGAGPLVRISPAGIDLVEGRAEHPELERVGLPPPA